LQTASNADGEELMWEKGGFYYNVGGFSMIELE